MHTHSLCAQIRVFISVFQTALASILIGSPALRVFAGQPVQGRSPGFQEPPQCPGSPGQATCGTVAPALPTPLPWPRASGVAFTGLCHGPVPARADALLQIRREGCSGDADLVGFSINCVEMIWGRAMGVKEGIAGDV